MRLINYIEQLQKKGQRWFIKSEAMQQLGCSAQALQQAIYDLTCKKRLAPIRGEFVVIVPFEYESWGIVPAEHFIDPLMKYLNSPYYIAVLSAGQFHGAAHQKPMQFQVVTNQRLRNIKYERIYIRFLYGNNMPLAPTQRVMVQTGYAIAATPETTAFDLCKYYKAAGYWSNIGTVLMELLEEINIDKLCQLAVSGIYGNAIIQRLGYVLSRPEIEGNAFAEALYKAVEHKLFRWVPLSAGQKYTEEFGYWARDDKWKILINSDIEVDL